MTFRNALSPLAFAPVRIGVTVVASITGLLGIVAAVRPDMVMGLMHALMSM